jgi:hypothetical protein
VDYETKDVWAYIDRLCIWSFPEWMWMFSAGSQGRNPCTAAASTKSSSA